MDLVAKLKGYRKGMSSNSKAYQAWLDMLHKQGWSANERMAELMKADCNAGILDLSKLIKEKVEKKKDLKEVEEEISTTMLLRQMMGMMKEQSIQNASETMSNIKELAIDPLKEQLKQLQQAKINNEAMITASATEYDNLQKELKQQRKFLEDIKEQISDKTGELASVTSKLHAARAQVPVYVPQPTDYVSGGAGAGPAVPPARDIKGKFKGRGQSRVSEASAAGQS